MIDCSLYYERELKRELFGYACLGPGEKYRKGLLEFASRGTCYMSRIEELSPGIQASFLDFLSSGCFARLGDGKEISSGVRLIVSSEKNLTGFVQAGLFDAGLYAALAKLTICLTPLRERKDDIPQMVQALINAFCAEHQVKTRAALSPETLEALQAYPWPANFVELEKEIARLMESGLESIRPENLAMEIASYWLGQRGDPEVRKVLEELDGYIREFRILSRLEAGLGEAFPTDREEDLELGGMHLRGEGEAFIM
jgi:DNA-binding NtrC family response regulator